MSKKTGIAAIIICLIALAVSVASLALTLRTAGTADALTSEVTKQDSAGDIQYVLYLGTNDKDTNEPVYAPEEAKEKAQDILIRYFGGFTIQDANGGWIDDDTVYREYTIVIYLSDTDIGHVHAAADELIEAFNQSSILIQSNRTQTEFYAG